MSSHVDLDIWVGFLGHIVLCLFHIIKCMSDLITGHRQAHREGEGRIENCQFQPMIISFLYDVINSVCCH